MLDGQQSSLILTALFEELFRLLGGFTSNSRLPDSHVTKRIVEKGQSPQLVSASAGCG